MELRPSQSSSLSDLCSDYQRPLLYPICSPTPNFLPQEKRKEEERERRKAKEKAKREQLKKEGKLLTGKAKAEADRLAAMRAQMLSQAAQKGGG